MTSALSSDRAEFFCLPASYDSQTIHCVLAGRMIQ
nr:MAG TPA: hypothetical protein [Caudoviricetes sp.]